MTTVTKTVRFDAAHVLTGYDGACRNLHGHTYRVDVSAACADGVDAATGMVVDLKALKELVAEVLLARFDHAFLYDTRSPGECDIASAVVRQGMRAVALPFRTTVENLARHFYELLKGRLASLVAVKVWETADNCAEYRA